MPTLTVSWDAKSLGFIRKSRLERAVLSTTKKAGGDAIRAVRAEAKRRVRERVRIRAGYLANRALPLVYPKGAERLEGLVWRVDVSGAAVPLGEYPRRQTRRGVSVEVQVGKRSLIQSAFLAASRGGRKGVFLRPGKARYPMGHRLGLNVADSMADGRVPELALQRGRVVFETAFARLIGMELSGGR
jgi:hypothetical protein